MEDKVHTNTNNKQKYDGNDRIKSVAFSPHFVYDLSMPGSYKLQKRKPDMIPAFDISTSTL